MAIIFSSIRHFISAPDTHGRRIDVMTGSTISSTMLLRPSSLLSYKRRHI
jgi:hypothetical protein